MPTNQITEKIDSISNTPIIKETKNISTTLITFNKEAISTQINEKTDGITKSKIPENTEQISDIQIKEEIINVFTTKNIEKTEAPTNTQIIENTKKNLQV